MKKSVRLLWLNLPVDNIAAIVTSEGAANSHMVIVARALGIPTVVGVTELPITTLDDIEMIVDAYQGRSLSLIRHVDCANDIKKSKKKKNKLRKT